MKKVLVVVFAVALGLSAVASAQVPNVAVYFDKDLQFQQGNCPAEAPGTVSQTLYVVANNFGIWMNGIEYQITYPPQITWLGDFPVPGALSIGSSPLGIGITFPTPLEAFTQAVVQTVNVLWMCDHCEPLIEYPIVVGPFPSSGLVRAVRWPDLHTVIGVGMTSLICATTPIQETTWGQIKALYE